jgi:pyocin large subunit-like protein
VKCLIDDYTSALQIVGEYISEALSVKLSSRIGHVAASTESEETAAVSKRKSDWEMALELEKETGAQYSAAPAKKLAEPPAKVSAVRTAFVFSATCRDGVVHMCRSPRAGQRRALCLLRGSSPSLASSLRNSKPMDAVNK